MLTLLNALHLVALFAVLIGMPLMVIGSQTNISAMTSAGFILLLAGLVVLVLTSLGAEAIENLMPSRGDCMPRC